MEKKINEIKQYHNELLQLWEQWFNVVHPNGFNPPFVEWKREGGFRKNTGVRPLHKVARSFNEYVGLVQDYCECRNHEVAKTMLMLDSNVRWMLDDLDATRSYKTVLGGYEGRHRVYEGVSVKPARELEKEGIFEKSPSGFSPWSAPLLVIPIPGEEPVFMTIHENGDLHGWYLVPKGTVEPEKKDYVSVDFVV